MGAVGLWRTWDFRLLWLGAVDVVCTLLLIGFLLTGHHHLVVRVLAVLAWAVVVPRDVRAGNRQDAASAARKRRGLVP